MFRYRPSLLTVLVATTVAVTAALSWAGWRLLVQQQAIDEQRAEQQLESTAASMVAALRGRIAEAGERLSDAVASSTSAAPFSEDSVLLTIAHGEVTTAGVPLPFVPAIPARDVPPELFAEGETFEFAGGDLTAAAARYDALVGHPDAAVRGEALLRLGRVLRKSRRFGAALRAYQQLAALGAVRVGDLPAELAGLYGQRAALQGLGNDDRQRGVTREIGQGLDAGRWLLTRGVAEFYRNEIGRPGRPQSWALADALDRAWSEAGGQLPPRGQRVFGESDRAVLVIWRAGERRAALLAAYVDSFTQWRAAGAVQWHLADAEGRRIAGTAAALDSGVTRVAGDAEYPWMLQVAAPPGTTMRGRMGRDTLVAMMASMLLFLWGATYFMARAIRREAAVAQLQSDFVAAVSHEFRSPLTTIRQMAEMLELGRVPGEERRQTYYRVLAAEAGRLQRLVETLLHFGRIEAGAVRYQFAEIDAASLVRSVVRDLQPVARQSGKRLEMDGPRQVVLVRADESALAVALRNLIDNAIKYSPDEPTVRVEWRIEDERAAISVVDRGIGIPRAEQQAVFRKFVRGRAAVDGNVKGTGVGLAMVQQIVAAHGGEVQLESEVGRGSTFTIVLPAANAEALQRTAAAS